MDSWRTAIVDAGPTHIRVRGHDVLGLMQGATFTDLIFLLHCQRLPSDAERRVVDAILIGSADHGSGAPSCAAARLAASGNRQSLSAAVAAGLLAIGDAHGGAGTACMEMIADGLDRAEREALSLDQAAALIVDEAKAARRRLPGFGHRVHSTVDPRVELIFGLAAEGRLAGDGIRFVRAIAAALRARSTAVPVNIDGALAAVLHDLGLPSQLGALLFIVARVAGVSAEVLEEHLREEPMRIRIPVEYDGPVPEDVS
jgi:citrate synthase